MPPARLRAEFEIVTPMFLGGAEHEASRIRGTAVKGALAFWWRALNFARFVENANGNANDALNIMRERERQLFGSSQNGQGAFLLRVKDRSVKTGTNLLSLLPCDHTGAKYLGYALIRAFGRKEGDRDYLEPGGRFNIEIIPRPNKLTEIVAELLPVIKLFGLLGGLGARVRRGWGSVALTNLLLPEDFTNDFAVPTDREAYAFALKALLPENAPHRVQSGRNWQLTAFSRESSIWIGNKRIANAQNPQNGEKTKVVQFKNAGEALDWLGRALLDYRSWGQNGSVEGQPVQQQFFLDHNWFKNENPQIDLPYRLAFGLPHNYFKYIESGNHLRGSVNTGRQGRRASPMFFHIHKVGDCFLPVVAILPTRFVDAQIIAERNTGHPNRNRAAYDLYETRGGEGLSGLQVLEGFIKGVPGKLNANRLMSFEQVLP